MEKTLLSQICQAFSIHKPTTEAVEIDRGCIHVVWHFAAGQQRYILKQLAVSSAHTEEALFKYRCSEKIASTFAKHGIPAVTALGAEHEPIQCVHSHYYMMYEYIDGISPVAQDITLDECALIGKLLKQIHDCAVTAYSFNQGSFRNEIYTPTFDENEWQKLCDIAQHQKMPDHTLLALYLPEIRATCAAFAESLSHFRYRIIAHRDLHVPNVLWRSAHEYHLIDWELAGPIDPIIDVLYTAIHWSMIWPNQFSFPRFESLLQGYRFTPIDAITAERAMTVVKGMWLSWLRDQLMGVLGLQVSDANPKYSVVEVSRVLHAYPVLLNQHGAIIHHLQNPV